MRYEETKNRDCCLKPDFLHPGPNRVPPPTVTPKPRFTCKGCGPAEKLCIRWLLSGVLAIVALFVAQVPLARAGGGPENLFLVVNSRSVSSLAVANHYAARARSLRNILHLDWDGEAEGIDIEAFRHKLLIPAIEAIVRRGLAGQIDYLVYSSDFPYHVDFASDLPPNRA